MSAAVLILVLAAGLTVVVAMKSVTTVPESHAGIVERLGRYRATLSAGRGVVVPFVDSVRHQVDLRAQVCALAGRSVVTEDDVTASVDVLVHFQVFDPVLATYEITDYHQGLDMLALTLLRSTIADLTFEQARAQYRTIGTTVHGELDRAAAAWGIRVTRVEVEQIGHASFSRDTTSP